MPIPSAAKFIPGACAAIAAAASPAGAVSIVPVADGRMVRASGAIFGFDAQGLPVLQQFVDVSVPAPTPFGPWDKTLEVDGPPLVSRARLAGNVVPTQISGSGSGFGTTSGDPLSSGSASSTYSITFQVDEAADGSLAGNLFGDGTALEGFAMIQLAADGVVLFEEQTESGDFRPTFAFDHLYVPGVVYELLARGSGSPDSSADFLGHTGGYNFTLTLVPEPGTLLLVLGGIGVLARRAAMRRVRVG